MAYAAVIAANRRAGYQQSWNPPILYDGHHVIDSHLTDSTVFSFVDFVPMKNEREGALPFSSLLTDANVWLAKHLQYEAIKCETIVIPFESHDVAMSSDYCVLVPDQIRSTVNMTKKWSYVRGLRLWIRKREAENQVKIAQIIAMMDIRPHMGRKASTDSDVASGSSTDDSEMEGESLCDEEGIETLVTRLNDAAKTGKLVGRVFCIETLDCESSSNGRVPSPEETLVRRHDGYVRGLRVFYEESHSSVEEDLCIKDFVPKYLGGGSIIRKPTFEPTDQVVFRIARWLSLNPEVKLLNLQTVEVRCNICTNIETGNVISSKKGDQIRILRLAYSKPRNSKTRSATPAYDSISLAVNDTTGDTLSIGGQSYVGSSISQYSGPPPPAPIYVASRLFAPVDESDKLPQVERRMQDFIRELDPNDLRLLTAETVHTYMKSISSKKRIDASFEHTFQSSRFGCVEMVFGIRLYYDEGYFDFKKREAARQGQRSSKDQRGDYYVLGPDTPDLETRSLHLGAESRDDLFDKDDDGFKLRQRSSCGVS